MQLEGHVVVAGQKLAYRCRQEGYCPHEMSIKGAGRSWTRKRNLLDACFSSPILVNNADVGTSVYESRQCVGTLGQKQTAMAQGMWVGGEDGGTTHQYSPSYW